MKKIDFYYMGINLHKLVRPIFKNELKYGYIAYFFIKALRYVFWNLKKVLNENFSFFSFPHTMVYLSNFMI